MREPEPVPPVNLPRVRLNPFGLFWMAFTFLLGSLVAIAFAQFRASHSAPWYSLGFSGAAVVFTLAAVVTRSE